MTNDDAVKTGYINLRVTDGERERIQKIADELTAGDVSNLQRHLFSATEKALNKYGATRLIWPPELNYFPDGTKTAQDLMNEKGPANE